MREHLRLRHTRDVGKLVMASSAKTQARNIQHFEPLLLEVSRLMAIQRLVVWRGHDDPPHVQRTRGVDQSWCRSDAGPLRLRLHGIGQCVQRREHGSRRATVGDHVGARCGQFTRRPVDIVHQHSPAFHRTCIHVQSHPRDMQTDALELAQQQLPFRLHDRVGSQNNEPQPGSGRIA